jgi:hypothetical protein
VDRQEITVCLLANPYRWWSPRGVREIGAPMRLIYLAWDADAAAMAWLDAS